MGSCPMSLLEASYGREILEMRPFVMVPFIMGLFEASRDKEIVEMRPFAMGLFVMRAFVLAPDTP